jgi:hypothetical protein
MDETTWLSQDEPERLLRFAGRSASLRRLRLLGCACCRLIWYHIERDYRQLVPRIERYADGRLDGQALVDALGDVPWSRPLPAEAMAVRDLVTVPSSALESAIAAARTAARLGLAQGRQRVCALIRDVFRPFQAGSCERALVSADVRRLARATYAERSLPGGELDGAGLAVLADALEEAGCAGEALLGHLRGAGPHVRGCWAVDLVLARQ